jgi:hypothetical protein
MRIIRFTEVNARPVGITRAPASREAWSVCVISLE